MWEFKKRQSAVESKNSLPATRPVVAPAAKEKAAEVIGKAQRQGRTLLTEAESKEILSAYGADAVINFKEVDPVVEIMRLTKGRGVDVAIEALGTPETFENCLRVLRPGGTLSSLGVYSGKLTIPQENFAAGLGDHKIVTTLCPGGKERMRRLMEVVAHKRVDLTPLLTHTFKLDDIAKAYELFGQQKDVVLKVAIRA